MNDYIGASLLSWGMAVIMHYYRNYLLSKYYSLQEDIESIGDSERKKKQNYLSFFKTYINGLNTGKWALFILGMLCLIKFFFNVLN